MQSQTFQNLGRVFNNFLALVHTHFPIVLIVEVSKRLLNESEILLGCLLIDCARVLLICEGQNDLGVVPIDLPFANGHRCQSAEELQYFLLVLGDWDAVGVVQAISSRRAQRFQNVYVDVLFFEVEQTMIGLDDVLEITTVGRCLYKVKLISIYQNYII